MGPGRGAGGVPSLVMGSSGLRCTPPSGSPLGRLHRDAVSPLFTMENMKPLSPSDTFFFLRVGWLWHLSLACFIVHCLSLTCGHV